MAAAVHDHQSPRIVLVLYAADHGTSRIAPRPVPCPSVHTPAAHAAAWNPFAHCFPATRLPRPLGWCLQGCVHVYRLCLRPLLFANEKRIDTLLDRSAFAAGQAYAEIRDVASELFLSAISAFGRSIFVAALNKQSADEKSRDAGSPPQSPSGNDHDKHD
jgi:hypothetical protein